MVIKYFRWDSDLFRVKLRGKGEKTDINESEQGGNKKKTVHKLHYQRNLYNLRLSLACLLSFKVLFR